MSVIDAVTNDSGTNPAQNASDILASLVGEGKKFATVEDLARGKAQSDEFIPQLQRENAEMREALKEMETKLTQQKTLTEVVDALKQANGGTGNNQTQISPEELTKLVRSITSQEREQESRTVNRQLVDQTLVTKFGDTAKAKEAVLTKARELGLGAIQIKELSETSPAAFLQLFGATQSSTPKPQTTVRGNVSSEAQALLPDGGERNYAYYSALRKKMGSAAFYADINLQRQKHSDADRLGEKFMTN